MSVTVRELIIAYFNCNIIHSIGFTENIIIPIHANVWVLDYACGQLDDDDERNTWRENNRVGGDRMLELDNAQCFYDTTYWERERERKRERRESEGTDVN